MYVCLLIVITSSNHSSKYYKGSSIYKTILKLNEIKYYHSTWLKCLLSPHPVYWNPNTFGLISVDWDSKQDADRVFFFISKRSIIVRLRSTYQQIHTRFLRKWFIGERHCSFILCGLHKSILLKQSRWYFSTLHISKWNNLTSVHRISVMNY